MGRLIQRVLEWSLINKSYDPRSEIEVEVLLSLLAEMSAPSIQHGFSLIIPVFFRRTLFLSKVAFEGH